MPLTHLTQVRVIDGWVDQSHRADIKVTGEDVFNRRLFNNCLFNGREFGVELLFDGLGNLTLDCENIRQTAFVTLRPDVSVSAGIAVVRSSPSGFIRLVNRIELGNALDRMPRASPARFTMTEEALLWIS
jgi:hypothetical protein